MEKQKVKFYRINKSIMAASIIMALTACDSDDDDGTPSTDGTDSSSEVSALKIYTDYPVTLDPGAPGADPDTASKTTSVSYSGQMARHAYRESLKTLLKSPGETTEAAILAKINLFLKNLDGAADGEAIVAPVDKNDFDIKENTFSDLSTGKSLYNDAFSASQAEPIPGADQTKIMGVPGNLNAQQVLDLWAVNHARNFANTADGHFDMVNGYEWDQMFAKFLMGAVFYNLGVDKYLDEYIEAGTKSNSLPYGEGKHYTGKEHSWDEGFGYFGAAANYGVNEPQVNYNIKKQVSGTAASADWNSDSMVSIYHEYTSGPAYYAADADKSGNSTYGRDIMAAWIAGRDLIAAAVESSGYARDLNAAEIERLKGYAQTIQRNWEMVIAEAVYKYAGSSYNDIETYQTSMSTDDLKTYYHHWAEGKAMMLSLQFGGSESKIDKANFEDIDNLWGYGPVTADGSQVNGVSGNSFTKSDAPADAQAALDAYQENMKMVQQKLDALYSLKVKQNEIEWSLAFWQPFLLVPTQTITAIKLSYSSAD